MAVELRISEYVPRTVIWTRRLCKGILLGCLAAVTILFAVELSAVEELRTQCDRVEETAIRYGKLMEEGDGHCAEGEIRQGERCYLTALQMNTAIPEPYLKLAQIYREYRCYDLAIQILEEYPGEDEEITAAVREIRTETEKLEVSVFRETGTVSADRGMD